MNKSTKILMFGVAFLLASATATDARQTAKRNRTIPQAVVAPKPAPPAPRPAPVFTAVKPKDAKPVVLRTPRTEQELQQDLGKGVKP